MEAMTNGPDTPPDTPKAPSGNKPHRLDRVVLPDSKGEPVMGEPKPTLKVDLNQSENKVVIETSQLAGKDDGEEKPSDKKAQTEKRAAKNDRPSRPPKPAKPAKRGIGLPTALFLSLISAGGGAIGGAYLTQYWPQTEQTAPALTEAALADMNEKSEAAQSALAKDIQSLKQQLDKLTAEPETEPTESATLEPALLNGLSERLDALEGRAFIESDNVVVDPSLLKRLTALEAKQEALQNSREIAEKETKTIADNEAFVALNQDIKTLKAEFENLSSNAKEDGLDEQLSARLEALENAPAIDIPDVDLSPLTNRIKKVETRLKNQGEAIRDLKLIAPLPKFPREAVLKAVADAKASDENKGWFSQTLSKHVSVADAAAVQIVDDIEKSILTDDIDKALKTVATLPSAGQDAAKEWVEAVRAQRSMP